MQSPSSPATNQQWVILCRVCFCVKRFECAWTSLPLLYAWAKFAALVKHPQQELSMCMLSTTKQLIELDDSIYECDEGHTCTCNFESIVAVSMAHEWALASGCT
jgi:hypothetical protein